MQPKMQLQTEAAYDATYLGKCLRKHWCRFLNRFAILGGRGEAIFAEILERYSEPHRTYHGLVHPVTLLDELHDLRRARSGLFLNAEEDLAIELALWDHDLVYDAQAKDNEEQSADRAFAHSRVLGFSERVGVQTRRLVLATKHTDVHKELAVQIVTDIDLSPLAAPWPSFARNSRQIREEYAHVSDEDFRLGRRNFILGMLRRHRIFSTGYYFKKLEGAARANIKQSLHEQFAL